MRRHPDPPDSDRAPPAGEASAPTPHPIHRLNLLLSTGGWQPDPWVQRLPRILDPMGVRSHIAASARSAERVIQGNIIHIAIVDLALPLEDQTTPDDEAGVQLLELLSRMKVPPPTVVIKRRRSARDDRREIAAALRAGAFAVVDRPNAQTDLEALLEVLRRCLTRHYAGRWPGTTN
jgi:DNA-binding NtrC family response regulator